MKLLLAILCISFSCSTSAQSDFLKNAKEHSRKLIHLENDLSENDMKEGLTNALRNGAEYAVQKASALNGFNENLTVRIPFPQEASKIASALSKIGMEEQIKLFEVNMNHAAEQASKKALNIIIDAIKNMNITDAFSILQGDDNAATNYLRNETNEFLYQSFKPVIVTSMQEFQVAQKWNRLVTKYNSIPLTQKINPDLEDYITNKAMDGLFILIAEQEQEIRLNPYARTSEILKKVFGEN